MMLSSRSLVLPFSQMKSKPTGLLAVILRVSLTCLRNGTPRRSAWAYTCSTAFASLSFICMLQISYSGFELADLERELAARKAAMHAHLARPIGKGNKIQI